MVSDAHNSLNPQDLGKQLACFGGNRHRGLGRWMDGCHVGGLDNRKRQLLGLEKPGRVFCPPPEQKKTKKKTGVKAAAGKMKTTKLVEAALGVLNEADPVMKAQLGEAAATGWLQDQISFSCPPDVVDNSDPDSAPPPPANIPDRPARLPTVKLVPSHLMAKLGKGGSLHSRQAILHSLVHTESWAIDLSWDIIARFGTQESMPTQFFTDFVKVARDEGRHFTLLAVRLQQLGSFYGAFPAHDGLWDSAIRTSHSLLARLAVEHCVHEARGLDVLPTIISRFRNGGDECTAKLLETVVYPDEITHCAAGVKWFRYLCFRKLGKYPDAALIPGCVSSHNPVIGEGFWKQRPVTHEADGSVEFQKLTEENGSDEHVLVIPTFHSTVRGYFRGPLKPPFNETARKAAGFEPEWYEPLAMKEQKNTA